MTTDITELAQSLKATAEPISSGYLRNWIVSHDDETCWVGANDDDGNLTPFIEVSIADWSGNKADNEKLARFIALCRPANVLALVEALEKAREEAEELSKFKEVMTSAAEALKAGKPLNLESLFKGELASAMFAMMFAGEFVRSGATNYLELLYDVPEFGEMTVTLQKVEGKTPGQRIAELEESHAQVIQSRDHYKRMTEEGLKRLAESRTVKLPKAMRIEGGAYCSAHAYYDSNGDYYDRADVVEMLVADGIKWEAE